MRIRDLTLLLATLLGAIAASSMVVTAVVLFDNRELRQEMRELRRGWGEAASENQQLKQERSETETALSTQAERLQKLEAELAEVRSSIPTNAASAPQAGRAYRARVFLGRQYLGQGWVTPGQAAPDANTGQARYEPVVLLDPGVRAGIAAGKANVIEREVTTPTTINYNYPYPYYSYGWWPTSWTVPTDGKGCDRPERPAHLPPPPPRASPGAQVTATTVISLPRGQPFAAPITRNPGTGAGRPVLTLSPVSSQAVFGARPPSAQPRTLPLSSPLN